MSLPTAGAGRSVWSVQFFKENDGINFGTGANIDDLFTGDCTIELWIRGLPGASNYYIMSKTAGTLADGWTIVGRTDGYLVLTAKFATTDSVKFPLGALDNRWHHIAWDWDVGTLTARAFVGGVLAPVGTGVAVGAYQVDAARFCFVNAYSGIGVSDGAFSIGPIRISNSRRYTGASFDPPRRINWPANDANAQLITRMNDGAGATVTDYSGNGNDGTITFGASTRWYNDPV